VFVGSTFRPAPPAHLADDSLTFWIWLVVVLAVAVVGAIALSLRR
jgi:anti-sigma-K factor RskA